MGNGGEGRRGGTGAPPTPQTNHNSQPENENNTHTHRDTDRERRSLHHHHHLFYAREELLHRLGGLVQVLRRREEVDERVRVRLVGVLAQRLVCWLVELIGWR